MTDDMMNLRALVEKSPDADLLREMIGFAAQRLMELEVAGQTGAGYGEKSQEWLAEAQRYRKRVWETPAAAVELRTAKLHKGSDFPSFLGPRRMAEKALTAMVRGPMCNASPLAWSTISCAPCARPASQRDRCHGCAQRSTTLDKHRFRIEYRPKTLLEAMRVQLALMLIDENGLVYCAYCHQPFEAGMGSGKRADAKFCSKEHRILHNSQKRTKR